MPGIIGRTNELKSLRALFGAEDPQFLAVYGRRRIGKTFLISEFFRDKGLYFELTGIKDAPLKVQLNNFGREYADVFNSGKVETLPATWLEAFDLLRKRVQDRSPGKKIILFFDELPWLASPRSQFLAALDHTWNRYFSRTKHIIVIICGSAASWMIKKVLQDKGGLYGRLTQKMQLLPFTLAETRLFLEAQQVRLTPPQLIEFYMAVGGVATYLTQLQAGRSVNQLIQERYFDGNAPLKGEFHKLFSSLFDKYERHLAIIEALAASHYGLSVDQILKKTGAHSGGGFSTLLTELLESGFLTFLPQLGNKKKAGKYLLTDEFTLFYLKWVRTWENQISDLDGYWQRQSNTQSFRAWAGYAFETLCLKNIAHIKQQLGIAGVTTRVSQWHESEAQIDLVIDRADNCINLCEIKYYNAEYVIGAREAAELQRKKARFLASTATKKALFVTLITANGVTRNQHYINTVDSHVQADRFVARHGEL
jgi:AAA+ ATPase superfamily predicted ATPase